MKRRTTFHIAVRPFGGMLKKGAKALEKLGIPMDSDGQDDNRALAALDPKKHVEVSFRDIMIDYKKFKEAYYLHQLYDEAEINKNPENQV